MARPLEGMKIAILATDMVEESELIEPIQALEEAGAIATLISTRPGEIITANHFDQSESYPVDLTFDQASPEDFDALFIPGGVQNSDHLRADPVAQNFVIDFDESGKPIAVICHGPWLLVSAGLVDGRHLTSYYTIADDIQNAGGEWSNEPVVVDGNWVSSRKPDDLPEFNLAMVRLFAKTKSIVLA
jgi:protease I